MGAYDREVWLDVRNFIWVGGVQGWRTGLKIRGRPFDSDPTHHRLIRSEEVTAVPVGKAKTNLAMDDKTWTLAKANISDGQLQDRLARP